MNEKNVPLQQQVDLLKNELLRLQTQAALGELLGTTTHEFNNILMTVINYAKLGLRHRDESSRDRALERILSASQRAAKITNSVLGMARNRSSQLEPTSLKPLIEESLLLLEREMRKYRINVETDLREVPPACAIGNQIQQVLLNLLTNARQAIKQGGNVWILLDHDPKEQMVLLTIRDNGPGIPADRLPKLFEPYYTTKTGPDETGKGGTGLGLFSCREIIQSHHGRIRVESSEGVGTAFIIRIPVAKSSAANVVTANIPMNSLSRTN
jgi:signal transduction histidine kinase